MQTYIVIALAIVAVGIACAGVFYLNEKNMQEIEANQKEIDALAERINELAKSQGASDEAKTESADQT